MTQKQNVAIVGAGLMGHGLALVFASEGHKVWITDPFPKVLETVKTRIASTLRALGRDEAAVDLVQTTPGLKSAVGEADIVIEAVLEKLPLKQAVFAELERHSKPDALLASNTSVIPIGQIAAKVESKHRVLGTHWWNPPYLVPLVEVIQAEMTSAEAVTRMLALLKDLGKVPVHVKKDIPGFVGNRLQHALWREAIALVADGVCDADTIDLVVKNSFGRRLAVLGPMENADLVGTDLTLDIHEHILAHLDRSQSPSPYLRSLVQEGKLGFKTNAGFKIWDDEKKNALRAAVAGHLQLLNQLFDTLKDRK